MLPKLFFYAVEALDHLVQTPVYVIETLVLIEKTEDQYHDRCDLRENQRHSDLKKRLFPPLHVAIMTAQVFAFNGRTVWSCW